MRAILSTAPFIATRRLMRLFSLCLVVGTTLLLAACGDGGKAEVKSMKEQLQRAYGNKDFAKVLDLSQKGLTLARKTMGDNATDTLYFAQAISEANMNLRNTRGAIAALRQELSMRSAAGQAETKLQARRTALIKIAEENGDKVTAGDQAVIVAKGINMGPGKDPQPVYKADTDYPPDQYRQKVEGDVDIAFGLDATGAVTAARVVKATPPMVFDQAALESFRKWRFTPMLDNTGQPVAGSGYTFTIAFRMGR